MKRLKTSSPSARLLAHSGPRLVFLQLANDCGGGGGAGGGHSLCFFPSHATTHLSKCAIIYLLPPPSSCSSPSFPYFFMPSTLKREPLCTGLSSLCWAHKKKEREKGNLKIGCCLRAEERDGLCCFFFSFSILFELPVQLRL